LYQQEPDALEAELTTEGRLASRDDGPTRLLVLMCHSNRDKVRAVLDGLGAAPLEDPTGLREELQAG
jgi:hypothetical protein